MCVVTYPDALAEQVIPPKLLSEKTIRIAVGDSCNMDSLSEKLIKNGFQQVDYVYEPGQYALRGSILDVFSYSFEYPFRVDFLEMKLTVSDLLRLNHSCLKKKYNR